MDVKQSTDRLELAAEAQDLLFREAHTPSAFTDEAVDEEQLRAVYELIKWGPTSMNQQPLRGVLLRTPQARQRLVRHMAEGNKVKTTKAPLTVVLFADRRFDDHLSELFPHVPDAKDYFAVAAFRDHSAQLNAALQAAYFILGVRAAGLAAGPMNGFDHAAVEEEFFPGGWKRALLAVNVGRAAPDSWFPRGPRWSFDDVFSSL